MEQEVKRCREAFWAIKHEEQREKDEKDALRRDKGAAPTAAEKKPPPKPEVDPVLGGPAHLYRNAAVPLKAASLQQHAFNASTMRVKEAAPDETAQSLLCDAFVPGGEKAHATAATAATSHGSSSTSKASRVPPSVPSRSDVQNEEAAEMIADLARGRFLAAKRDCERALAQLQSQFLTQPLAKRRRKGSTASIIAPPKKYFDALFFLGDKETLYPADVKQNACTVIEPRNIMRVEDLYPSVPLFADDPLPMTRDEAILAEANDDDGDAFETEFCPDDLTVLSPGGVADLHLVAALNAILLADPRDGTTSASQYSGGQPQLSQPGRKLIKDLFVIPRPPTVQPQPDDPRCISRSFMHDVGCIGVVLFVHGEWRWVIVDTTIATDITGSQPAFMQVSNVAGDLSVGACLKDASTAEFFPRSASGRGGGGNEGAAFGTALRQLHRRIARQRGPPAELWPFLLEKAAAKVLGGYANLDGGSALEMMSMLTGGVEHTFAFKLDHAVPPAPTRSLRSHVRFAGEGGGVRDHQRITGLSTLFCEEGAAATTETLTSFEHFRDILEGEDRGIIVAQLDLAAVNELHNADQSSVDCGSVSVCARRVEGMAHAVSIQCSPAKDGSFPKKEVAEFRQLFLFTHRHYVVSQLWRSENGVPMVELYSAWGPTVVPTMDELVLLMRKSATMNVNHSASTLRNYGPRVKASGEEGLQLTSTLLDGSARSGCPVPVCNLLAIDASFCQLPFEVFTLLFGKVDACVLPPRDHHAVAARVPCPLMCTATEEGEAEVEPAEVGLLLGVHAPLSTVTRIVLDQRPIHHSTSSTDSSCGGLLLQIFSTSAPSAEYRCFTPTSTHSGSGTNKGEAFRSVAQWIHQSTDIVAGCAMQTKQLSMGLQLEPGQYLLRCAAQRSGVVLQLQCFCSPLTILTLTQISPCLPTSVSTAVLPRQTVDDATIHCPDGADQNADNNNKNKEEGDDDDDMDRVSQDGAAERGWEEANDVRRAFDDKGMSLSAGAHAAFSESDILQTGQLDSRGLERAAAAFLLKHTPFGRTITNAVASLKQQEQREAEARRKLEAAKQSSAGGGERAGGNKSSAGSATGSGARRRRSSVSVSSAGSSVYRIQMGPAQFESLMVETLLAATTLREKSGKEEDEDDDI